MVVEAQEIVEIEGVHQEGEDKMKKNILCMILLVGSILQADMFDKGRSNVGVSIGAGTSLGGTYTIFGLNANYFVIDNLNVGVSYRGWFGATPTQNELSVATNYFVPLDAKFRPYGGVFVKKTFVSEERDFESYGVRGGVAVVMSKNSFLSLGYAYEQYSNCPVASECSNSYPEVIFALSF
jgi:hypothetical protein